MRRFRGAAGIVALAVIGTLVVGQAPAPAAGCTITGTAGHDFLHGTSAKDVICGLDGPDVLVGLGGDDVLVGGDGNDVLRPGTGADRVRGGHGRDEVAYDDLAGLGPVTVDLTAQSATGASGTDDLGSIDSVVGTNDGDTLTGSVGRNHIVGLAGDDVIQGGEADDELSGGLGDDELDAGNGDNTLFGGAGDDLLVAGDGDDVLNGGTDSGVTGDDCRPGPGANVLTGCELNDNPAVLDIDPPAHAFASTLAGSSSAAQTFTVTNTGGVATGTITTALTGTDPGEFALSNDGCTGQALDGGESCTVDAAFNPTSAGARAASLDVSATPGGGDAAALTGTGLDPANLTVSPLDEAYGNVQNGTTSGTQTFTITNTGDVTSGTVATSIAGVDPTEFTLSADTCNGQTLAGGGSCTFAVAFAPTGLGPKSAAAQATATPGGTAAATVSGNSVATAAQLQVSITDFAAVAPGTYVTSHTRIQDISAAGQNNVAYKVWIKNFGEADAHISNSPVPLNPSNVDVIVYQGFSTCGVVESFPASAITFTDLVLEGGTECYIGVGIDPQAPGPYSASANVLGTPGGSILAAFQGNGT